MIDKKHIVKIEEFDGKIDVQLKVEPITENDFKVKYITYRLADVENYLKNSLDKDVGLCYKSCVVSNRLKALSEGTFGFKLNKMEKNAIKKTTSKRKTTTKSQKVQLQRISDMEKVPMETQAPIHPETPNQENDLSNNRIKPS